MASGRDAAHTPLPQARQERDHVRTHLRRRRCRGRRRPRCRRRSAPAAALLGRTQVRPFDPRLLAQLVDSGHGRMGSRQAEEPRVVQGCVRTAHHGDDARSRHPRPRHAFGRRRRRDRSRSAAPARGPPHRPHRARRPSPDGIPALRLHGAQRARACAVPGVDPALRCARLPARDRLRRPVHAHEAGARSRGTRRHRAAAADAARACVRGADARERHRALLRGRAHPTRSAHRIRCLRRGDAEGDVRTDHRRVLRRRSRRSSCRCRSARSGRTEANAQAAGHIHANTAPVASA